MSERTDDTQSDYLNYLPGIYHQDAAFLNRFLLAFERVLTGVPEQLAELEAYSQREGMLLLEAEQRRTRSEIGLEQKIDLLYRFFDPDETPAEFLSWLAGWVALSLRDDWSEDEKRTFIRHIVSLYRFRGTRTGLQRMLEIYTEARVEIDELELPMQIGVRSTVGVNTYVGETPPHHFKVIITFSKSEYVDYLRREQIARAIIDQEKPAHTTYELYVSIPTMQINVHSTVGVDTVLGTYNEGASRE